MSLQINKSGYSLVRRVLQKHNLVFISYFSLRKEVKVEKMSNNIVFFKLLTLFFPLEKVKFSPTFGEVRWGHKGEIFLFFSGRIRPF